MGLNFLGLGFSFGAKDEGLDQALVGIRGQFEQLNDAVKSFQLSTAEELQPFDTLTRGVSDQLDAFQSSIASGVDFDTQGAQTQLQGFQERFVDFQDEASGGVDLGTRGLQDQLRAVQEAAGGVDLSSALDIDPSKVTEAIPGIGEGLKDLDNESGNVDLTPAIDATGFGRLANSVMGSAGRVTGALGWIGLALGPVISGFGSAMQSAGGMVDSLTRLSSRAGRSVANIVEQQVNLTNSLEGEALSYSVSARQAGANMGYVGRELNRFTSRATGLSMALNIGADESARAIRAVDEAGSELHAMGLRTLRDAARFTAAFGINADVLRNSGLSMRNEFSMTDESIAQLVSSITAMGQGVGDLTGGLNELPQVLGLLRRRRALGDTPEQLQQFASDMAAASRGIWQFVQDSDLARSTSASLADQLTTNRESFRNMFVGAEAEFPQLMSEISIVTGSIDRAFDTMTQGPGQFLQSMQEVVQQVRDSGGDVEGTLEFMRGRLQQTFGADQTGAMINFWRSASSETLDTMQSIRTATRDLGELGRQTHRTGRTAQEVFERMQAGFQTAMRSIARRDTADFLRRTRESLQGLQVAAMEAARSTGPVSDVMGVLSRTQTLGALALMPRELRGSAVAANELRGQITPLIQAFSSWGGVLDTVLGYVSIFATSVISTWGRIQRANRDLDPMAALGQAIDEESQRFAGILNDWIGRIENFVVRAVDAFANLDFSALFRTTPEGEEDQGVMGAIRRVLNRLGEIDWGHIWSQLRAGLNNLFKSVRPWLEEKMNQLREVVVDRVGAWWDSIDWSRVFRAVGSMGESLWEAVRPALSVLGDLIGSWLREHWVDIVLVSSAALTAAMGLLIVGAVVAALALAVAPFVGAFAAMHQGVERWGEDIVHFFRVIGQLLYMEWQSLEEALSLVWRVFVGQVESSWTRASQTLSRAWGRLVQSFRSLWTTLAGWFQALLGRMTSYVSTTVGSWQTIFVSVRQYFLEVGDSIRNAVGGAVNWVRSQWDTFVSRLEGVWTGLSSGWGTFLAQGEQFWQNLVGLPDRIRTGWQGIVEFFRTMFASIRQVVGEDLAQAGQFFERLADVGSRALRFIMRTGEETFGHSLHTVIGEDMARSEEVMTSTARSISEVIQAVLHDATVQAIVTGFSRGFATVVEGMGEFSDRMVRAFTSLATRISEIMTSLFTSVVTQAQIAMVAAETAVEGIIGRLRTITEAQATLASARAAAVESLSRPADEEAMRRRMAQLSSSPVLQAIHHPDWYGGSPGAEGYQTLFVRHMTSLRQAIEALGVAPGSGSLEERRRIIREAGEALTRSRVGGHPGVPGVVGR